MTLTIKLDIIPLPLTLNACLNCSNHVDVPTSMAVFALYKALSTAFFKYIDQS